MELRQPEEPPSGAPYLYRKEKETHELIFSWLSWLAVLLLGAYATRQWWQQSHNMAAAAILQIIGWQRHAALVYRVFLWYWTSMLWSIDTCQNKISADQYHVTYRGLKFTAHRGRVFFWSWPLTKCWFWIGSRAHPRLTCWKQGRIVRKPVNANPGLTVNRIITFSSIQMLFTALSCVYSHR